ncbi:MAG: ABC-F family ATP-binding cassette domain-containing protein [Bacteroidales bacterium]
MAENILSVENLYKSFGEKELIEDISFGINKGQKVALIARNGAGKSTLLNIIMNKDYADSGNVVFKKDIHVNFLSQNPELNPQMTIREYVLDGIDLVNNWDYENRINEILYKLNLREDNKKISMLSGGEKKKLALSKVLVEDSDLLILDEPTNHLDIEMIEWLENYLSRQNLTLLIVTHDRYFLDNVCSDICEMENGNIYRYKGDYNYFIEKKAEKDYNERIEIEKARNLYKKELEWMRRMPKARTTKSKARIDSFYQIKSVANKKIDFENPELSIRAQRIGEKILELSNICKSYNDKTLLKDFTYTFKKGEKIGIVGKNGAGKTTLLNIITQQLKPDNGKVVIGQTINFGYYSQEGLEEKDDMRVIDIIREVAESIALDNKTEISASQFLYYFGFSPELQYNYYSNLSGGERRRLYLLKVLMSNPNFLILDEPTNDLDIYTLAMLENFLKEYKGCLLIVSHDRSFMDNLVDHLFVFEDNGLIKDYHSTYSDYMDYKKEIENEKNDNKDSNSSESEINTKVKTKNLNKATYKEKKEYELLNSEIPKLEEEKKIIMDKLSKDNQLPEEISTLSERFQEIERELEEKEMRWLELSELEH